MSDRSQFDKAYQAHYSSHLTSHAPGMSCASVNVPHGCQFKPKRKDFWLTCGSQVSKQCVTNKCSYGSLGTSCPTCVTFPMERTAYDMQMMKTYNPCVEARGCGSYKSCGVAISQEAPCQ